MPVPVKGRAKQVGFACPECGNPLVERTSSMMDNVFWGCSTYPKCTFTCQPNFGENPEDDPEDHLWWLEAYLSYYQL